MYLDSLLVFALECVPDLSEGRHGLPASLQLTRARHPMTSTLHPHQRRHHLYQHQHHMISNMFDYCTSVFHQSVVLHLIINYNGIERKLKKINVNIYTMIKDCLKWLGPTWSYTIKLICFYYLTLAKWKPWYTPKVITQVKIFFSFNFSLSPISP